MMNVADIILNYVDIHLFFVKNVQVHIGKGKYIISKN